MKTTNTPDYMMAEIVRYPEDKSKWVIRRDGCIDYGFFLTRDDAADYARKCGYVIQYGDC